MNLEKFAKKYKRELRQNSDLSTEHIDESMRPFFPSDTLKIIPAITLDSPLPSYELLCETDLQDKTLCLIQFNFNISNTQKDVY